MTRIRQKGAESLMLLSTDLVAAIERDKQISERPEPRLPEVSFAARMLPGESGWPREKIERKNIE